MKNYRDMSPDEIEQDIVGTRAHIDRTLDVLTTRLSPAGLMDQAVRTARETGGEFGLNLGRTIRDNPVPTALLGLGVGWLMFAGRKSGDGGNGEYIEHYGYDDDDASYRSRRRRRYQVSASGLAPTATADTTDLDVPEDWSAAYDDQRTDESGLEGGSGGDRVQAAKAAGKDTYEQVRAGASGASASLAASAKRGTHAARDAADRAKASARDVRGRMGEGSRRTSERAKEMAHGLSDRASATAAQARLYGSSMADRAADAYHRGGYAAREAAGSAGSFAREHPLSVGLGIAALGAAIAAFLPRTRQEDELMGERADELKAAAREQAEVQAERARDAAAAAIDAGKEQAHEAGLTPEGIKERLNETAAAAANVAKSAADAGADKAKEQTGKPSGSQGESSADRPKTGKPASPASGVVTEPVTPAVGAPTPATPPSQSPTGGVTGASGIPAPPVQGGSFGSTMDSRPVSPPEPGKTGVKADEKK